MKKIDYLGPTSAMITLKIEQRLTYLVTFKNSFASILLCRGKQPFQQTHHVESM